VSTGGLGLRAAYVGGELAKLPAFVRRDFLTAISYRAAFVGDAVALASQLVLFYFVGQMVDESVLPSYGGTQASYLEFVVIGIAVGAFVEIGLSRIATVVRGEQLMGTLESLLVTPTATATIQIGSVAYDLVYVPLRTALFLGFTVAIFGLDFHVDGLLPSIAGLLVFVPFVWGLGLVGAAVVFTFRRGGGIVGLFATLLALGSGAYFPVTLLPGWAEPLAERNPVAITLEGMRAALIGGEGWPGFGQDVLVVAVSSLALTIVGVFALRWALSRERARGTMGLY
jgi:ABC-2 type transport system permease protein